MLLNARLDDARLHPCSDIRDELLLHLARQRARVHCREQPVLDGHVQR
jgi:hypothetical protein